MEQATFSELEHDVKKRRTRRELFLEKMDGLIPWKALEARIEPFYPKPGRGRRLRTGTIMDASIIEAPSSTKNKAGGRDPEMRQTKKGNQWHFGMKAHIGVDAESGLAHSLETTAANASDVTRAHKLLHGGERRAWGDSGYRGVGKREEHRDRAVAWRVAMRPGARRRLHPDGLVAGRERRKASKRAKVEHPFLYVKRHFGYGKVRYRGLAKNTERIAMLLGFANLLIAGRCATG